MSSPDDAAGAASAGQPARPAGLLEKLLSAIRPEFRTDVLVFDPRDPVFGGPPCKVAGCDRPKREYGMCQAHRRRWLYAGRPGLEDYIASCDVPGPGTGERIDLRCLAPHLRLEVQYVLQCRRDEEKAKIVPARLQPFLRGLAATEVSSLLDKPDHYWQQCPIPPKTGKGWRVFAVDAHHRIDVLASGHGWDIEYPRDVWRLRDLGIEADRRATVSFGQIPQPWLKDLAKRSARWQLTTGLNACYVAGQVRALTRFAGFLASPQVHVNALAQLDRPLLERYLADLHAELNGRASHGHHLTALAGLLRAIRHHGWDDTLPTTAVLFPEDYPHRGAQLPRALPGQVMAQIEQPANLARFTHPAYLLITLLLIRCGLRISDASKLPFDCLVTDADGAPYLRYYNHKMKREALVPIDDELHRLIGQQQKRVLDRWPSRSPLLFPSPRANLDGHRPVSVNGYRDALGRWLQQCDIRDEHGRPLHTTPHRFRHTLGTTLINKDVPQEVVRRILDHDSHEMTAHYARLSDTTIRRHWENARKVNARGENVTLEPDGPLADAAWSKQRLSRATQALPNGYCGLPIQQSCPHANACLSPCPVFITTAEFLPQHRDQHRATLQIITAAETRGQTRVAEMNRQVAINLEKIITALENDTREIPEANADAS